MRHKWITVRRKRGTGEPFVQRCERCGDHRRHQQERDCAFYVRDADGTVVARVNREGGSYTTRRRTAAS